MEEEERTESETLDTAPDAELTVSPVSVPPPALLVAPAGSVVVADSAVACRFSPRERLTSRC
jgi:hypothetical protein